MTELEHTNNHGSGMPLVHGPIQSIRLMIEYVLFQPEPNAVKIFERMAATCCLVIEVLLAVVADMKDDSVKEVELDDQIQSKDNQTQKVARLKKEALS